MGAVEAVSRRGAAAQPGPVLLSVHVPETSLSGGGVVTLVLRCTTVTSTLCQFNSDEAASNQPQLVVTI